MASFQDNSVITQKPQHRYTGGRVFQSIRS